MKRNEHDRSNTTFEIGGKSYNVVKKGVAQARQVSALGGWLATYGTQAYRLIQDPSVGSGGIEILGAILQHLDENALLELFRCAVWLWHGSCP